MFNRDYLDSLYRKAERDNYTIAYDTSFCSLEVNEVLKIPMFILQRDLNHTNINHIYIHTKMHIETHSRIFFPIPFIVGEMETKEIPTKDKNFSKIVNIDGQHRITAIKKIKDNDPDLYEKIKNQKVVVYKIIGSEVRSITKAYIDIHKQLDLDVASDQRYMVDDYNRNDVIEKFLNLLVNDLKTSKIINTFSKKHMKFKYFYSENFKKEMKNNTELVELLTENKLNETILYNKFKTYINNITTKYLTEKTIKYKYFDNGATGYRKSLKEELKTYKNQYNPLCLYHLKTYSQIVNNFYITLKENKSEEEEPKVLFVDDDEEFFDINEYKN